MGLVVCLARSQKRIGAICAATWPKFMNTDDEVSIFGPFLKLLGVMVVIWLIVTAIEGPQERKNPLADSEAEWQSLSTQEKADRIEREMRRQGAK